MNLKSCSECAFFLAHVHSEKCLECEVEGVGCQQLPAINMDTQARYKKCLNKGKHIHTELFLKN